MRRMARHIYDLGSGPRNLPGMKSLRELPLYRGREADYSRIFPVGVIIFLGDNMKTNREGNSGLNGLDLGSKLDVRTRSPHRQGQKKGRSKGN